MKKFGCLIISFFFLLLFVPNVFSSTCSTCSSGCTSPPSSSSSPGGDNPDDTYAVDSGFIREGTLPFTSDPNAVTFQNGYAKELTSFIDAYKKVEVKTDAASTALQLINSTPLLIIPSGGLYGYENSAFFKATLAEFVKQGATLIVFAQQHGYDFSILPTPDGKPLAAYGWVEDQNCFTNAVSIETWHQMLSGQSRSTPTVNVDGYFTSWPENATVLLRRTANGQPALLMYELGQGRVIVTSMYSDWAYGHGQASQEEIALVRDLLSWAKKPAQLPELRQGEPLTLPVTLLNSTSTDAALVRLQLYM